MSEFTLKTSTQEPDLPTAMQVIYQWNYDPEVEELIAFIESSRRGVIKAVPRGKGRGLTDGAGEEVEDEDDGERGEGAEGEEGEAAGAAAGIGAGRGSGAGSGSTRTTTSASAWPMRWRPSTPAPPTCRAPSTDSASGPATAI